MLPLQGIVVIDLVPHPLSGCSRIYADLGAEVIRIEPSDGARLSGRERVAYEVAQRGKRRLWLDPAKADDAATLEQLLRRADLLMKSPEQRVLVEKLDVARLRGERPSLVVCDVSMFGTGHDFSSWQATDAVLHALSGELSRSGIRGREPLLPPGEIGLQCAMAQAAYAGMASLFVAQTTGRGDHIDFSALDGCVQALDPGYGIGGSATMGRPAKQLSRGRPRKGFQYPIMRCADGYVRLCLLSQRQWRGMFGWMGEPEAFASPAFNKTAVRYQSPELLPAIAAFFADRTRAQLEREAEQWRVPLVALLSLDECLRQDHLRARNAIVPFDSGDLGRAPVLNGVCEIDGQRASALAALSSTALGAQQAKPPRELADKGRIRALAGVRVLDLGVIVVGGEQSRLLADLGADIVKVETTAFPDGTRQSYLQTGLSVGFAAGHRNKRSLGLNLRSARGRALFLDLVATADVVLSNFKPGTLESLGLGPDELAAVNPGVITLESSAYGHTGPWASRMGYGPLIRAVAGLTSRWCYGDDPEGHADSITVYPDHVAGRIGATVVLALMLRRSRTGKGGHARLAQLEVLLSHFEGEIAAQALAVEGAKEPIDAPWGVFAAAGKDEWCVVTVRNDSDWRALALAIGREDLLGRTDLASGAGRRRHAAEIDAAVSDWMQRQDATAAMQRLQIAGVPAGKMLRVADLPEFPYFEQRKLFRIERHPHLDEEVVAESFAAVSTVLAAPAMAPAPLSGEHTEEVLREWLELSDAEIARLIAEGVLEPTSQEILNMLARGEGRSEIQPTA